MSKPTLFSLTWPKFNPIKVKTLSKIISILLHAYKHTYLNMYVRMYVSTYKRTYILTYIHTYVSTYGRTRPVRWTVSIWKALFFQNKLVITHAYVSFENMCCVSSWILAVLTHISCNCFPSGSATPGQIPAKHERRPSAHRDCSWPDTSTVPACRLDCHWVQTSCGEISSTQRGT